MLRNERTAVSGRAWLEVYGHPDGSAQADIIEKSRACIRAQRGDERTLECRLLTLQHDKDLIPGHGNLPAGVDATHPISPGGPTSVWRLPV